MTIVLILLSLVFVVGLAGLVYPGELSHVSPRFNRWLYDRAARRYNDKWESVAYKDPAIQESAIRFARQCIEQSGVRRVLDLGCGTGHGIRLLHAALPADTRFTGVDFSPEMIRQFRSWLAAQETALSRRVDLVEEDLADWANRDSAGQPCGLVVMLEVGEFVPSFGRVIGRVSEVLADRGGLLLTRPAMHWSWFFPGRLQSRRALGRYLVSLGFAEPEFIKWRARYELVLCRRT